MYNADFVQKGEGLNEFGGVKTAGFVVETSQLSHIIQHFPATRQRHHKIWIKIIVEVVGIIASRKIEKLTVKWKSVHW